MIKKVVVIISFLPMVSYCWQENPNSVQDLPEIINRQASQWAEKSLRILCPEDAQLLNTLLEVSFRFSTADLALRKALHLMIDFTHAIEQQVQKIHEITDDPEFLGKLTGIIIKCSTEYNKQLSLWNSYVEKINNEKREQLLLVLKEADEWTQNFITNYIKSHQEDFWHEFDQAVLNSLDQNNYANQIIAILSRSVRTRNTDTNIQELVSSYFEYARLHACAGINSIMSMRSFFLIEEQLLCLRHNIAYAFYQATQMKKNAITIVVLE